MKRGGRSLRASILHARLSKTIRMIIGRPVNLGDDGEAFLPHFRRPPTAKRSRQPVKLSWGASRIGFIYADTGCNRHEVLAVADPLVCVAQWYARMLIRYMVSAAVFWPRFWPRRRLRLRLRRLRGRFRLVGFCTRWLLLYLRGRLWIVGCCWFDRSIFLPGSAPYARRFGKVLCYSAQLTFGWFCLLRWTSLASCGDVMR